MYKVTALSISGKHGKTHYQGSVISADQLYPDHIQALLGSNAIEKTDEDAVQTLPPVISPQADEVNDLDAE